MWGNNLQNNFSPYKLYGGSNLQYYPIQTVWWEQPTVLPHTNFMVGATYSITPYKLYGGSNLHL